MKEFPLLVLLLAVAGCASVTPQKVAGTYVMDTSGYCSHANQMTLVFDGDRSFTESGYSPVAFFDDGEHVTWVHNGLWSISNGVLTMRYADGESVMFRYARYRHRECLEEVSRDGAPLGRTPIRYLKTVELETTEQQVTTGNTGKASPPAAEREARRL